MEVATDRPTCVFHAQWSEGSLAVWAEGVDHLGAPGGAEAHPLALGAEELGRRLVEYGFPAHDRLAELVLVLPVTAAGRVLPSETLATLTGTLADEPEGLTRRRVAAAMFAPSSAPAVLDALVEERGGDEPRFESGAGAEYLCHVVGLCRHLLAQQRFVPMLAQESSGVLRASWRPWLSDEATVERLAVLTAGMPGIVRAVVDEARHQPWVILEDMLWRITDAHCRAALERESMAETVAGRDHSDVHVAWMHGLLDGADDVPATPAARQEMIRRVRRWIGGLEERGASSQWRLMLRLEEPAESADDASEAEWSLVIGLQAVEAPGVVIDAQDIWLIAGDAVIIEGRRLDKPQELLLAELARAARIYPRLEKALSEGTPADMALSTKQAYEFLREIRPVLLEQGFGVGAPAWWDAPTSRLGARLRLDSGSTAPAGDGTESPVSNGSPQLGLATLVDYRWEIAVGDATLTLAEFEKLATARTPLVRIAGRWVEIRPEDVRNAVRFIRENPGGRMGVGDAVRLAFGVEMREIGIPIVGIEAGGWLAGLLGLDEQRCSLPIVHPPETFKGTLRPYQVRGVSWMRFLERFGLGVCLADDMGLGKTIQLLALMLIEREEYRAAIEAGQSPSPVLPTLLVAPTSVLGNWMHETHRFGPSLRLLVHHGLERRLGDPFVEAAAASDLIVTTYALAHRDRELLERVRWGRVVLDEAQYIKNPGAKQSQAARSLAAERRVALTGTPVENRLSELWSIMEFLNPGFLGDAASFRKRFSVPIERLRDPVRADQLKGMVRPFILRRLKTDPGVVSDLPDKLEMREFCHLTGEQASLYESCVKRMLGEVERAEGIQRRGLVLSALIRLKQICNHPSQLLKDHDASSARPPEINRSGKSIRLVEQIDEVLAEDEQAIIFTQFRQMGHLLQLMLRHKFGRDVLFLHGGTPQKQRESIIKAFQKGDGSSPILILSLKAGGVGLNLTAATHVFHYDRWWNPAVENQATDRAYRIGQMRKVVVHKYLVRGTLEERIDQMIEQKTALAENIIGSGERWLTELSTDDLRQILELRSDAIGDEA
ncbi:MAG: DEAD/DEAH box helicase [Phycisphaeraceae bacterium]|nr:DEAD/DEAH box helicase [Phycisphaeraceae bacterium]